MFSERCRRALAALLAAAALSSAPALLDAQQAPASPIPPPSVGGAPAPVRGADLTVYLVTVGQGNLIWERFGHSALWFRDPAAGVDVAYNWGIFDFAQPGFVRRLARGQMLYWMEGDDPEQMLRFYAASDRSIWLQELNLSPEQREALWRFVQWNALPENRYYHYDYYRDNCSTRVRDAIDRVLGGQVERATAGRPAGTTYRAVTRQLLDGATAAYAGSEIALGLPADRPISEWEAMFIPMRMRDVLARVQVRAADGTLVPLVRAERQVFQAHRPPEPPRPPTYLPSFLLAGLVLGGALLLLGVAAGRGVAGARVTVGILATLWSVVAGVVGVLLVFFWTATDHVFMRDNESLLQFLPLSLLLAVLVPLALRRRPGREGRGVRRAALVTAALVAACSVIGLLLHLVPSLRQVNGEVIALALPVHLGLLLALRRAAPATR